MILFSAVAVGQEISVMTYNVRFDNPGDSLDRWDMRKESVVNFLREIRPTVFGTQEGKQHQVVYMDDNLADYAFVGVGRDRGDETGEYCALYYDTTVLGLMTSGTFWLSESGDTGVIGWDAAFTRICTYGHFRHDSGEEFWVYNAHFDHVGKVAREKAARQIVDSIQLRLSNGSAVVLLGDFNVTPDTEAFRIIDAGISCAWKRDPDWPRGPAGTFTGFDTSREPTRRIDHIFTSGFDISDYRHLDPRTSTGRGLSDHLPVIANLELAH